MQPSQKATPPDQKASGTEKQSMPAAELVTYDSREERATAMERDGFVFFPAVISKEEVRELRACSDRIQTVEIPGWDSIGPNGSGIKTIQNSFNRDALYLEYLDKPGVIELVEDVLGDDCHIIQMTSVEYGKTERPGNARGLETDCPTR